MTADVPAHDGPLSFDPFDASQTHTMWDLAKEFRRRQPVARLDNGFVFVSRYDDVRAVLRNGPDVSFSNEGGFRPTGVEVPLEDRNLGELDPPLHGPIRRLALNATSGRDAIEGLREFTRDQCRSLLASVLRAGSGDLVGQFSLPLTNRVIASMLGAPLSDADWLADKGEEIMQSTLAVTNETERGVGYAGAFPEFAGYVDDLVRQRSGRTDVPDDAISRVIRSGNDQGELSTRVVRMVLVNLLLGGTATTRDFLGSLFHELIAHPELHEQLAADPSLVPAAIEEGLRLAPPVLFLIRTCSAATELAGAELRPGDRVIAGIAAANRDEDSFDDPDAFRLDRADPAPHLSFGHGPHFCVGAGLARMEGHEALSTFLEQVRPGELRFAEDHELRYMPQPFLFGPVAVDVVR